MYARLIINPWRNDIHHRVMVHDHLVCVYVCAGVCVYVHVCMHACVYMCVRVYVCL